MKRILIFCPCAPYLGAEALVTLKLMRALLDWGYDVKMLYHQQKDIVIPFDALNIMDHCIGVKAGKGYFGGVMWCLKTFWIALWMRWKYDMIVSRAMPAYAHLPALLLKKIRHSKWIANWSDPYPAIIAPPPYGQGIKAKIPVLQSWYANAVIKHADWLTFPSNRLRNWLISFFPTLNIKSSVMPHIMLKDKQDSIHNYEDSKLRLIYTGALGIRNPEILLKTIYKIKTQKNELPIAVSFVGGKNPELNQMIDKYRLHEHVFNLGRKSYDETCLLVEQSDIAIVLEAPCEEGIFLPSKLLDYLQHNCSIWAISPSPGVLEDLINEYGGGVFTNCSSEDDLECQLIRLIELWQNRSIGKELDCSKLKEHFSIERSSIIWKEIEMQISK